MSDYKVFKACYDKPLDFFLLCEWMNWFLESVCIWPHDLKENAASNKRIKIWPFYCRDSENALKRYQMFYLERIVPMC